MDLNCPIPACACEQTIFGECDAEDSVVVCFEGFQELAGLRVPQTHCAIAAAACEVLSIMGKCDGIHWFGVSLEGLQQLSGVRVPQADCVILGSTGEHFSIG